MPLGRMKVFGWVEGIPSARGQEFRHWHRAKELGIPGTQLLLDRGGSIEEGRVRREGNIGGRVRRDCSLTDFLNTLVLPVPVCLMMLLL